MTHLVLQLLSYFQQRKYCKTFVGKTSDGTVVSRQIHIFSDASVTGYGAVAYLRLRDENDHVHCSFLMGKARLAPVKAVTIPRLELTEATVSVRIGQLLKKELDCKSDL